MIQVASSFATGENIELYREIASKVKMSMVDIFECWCLGCLKVPNEVIRKFYKTKNLLPEKVLDTDVESLIGDAHTKTDLTKLNKKYQQWLLKKQQRKQ